ncbi:MAG: hypothetical protein ACOZQL_37525 [Myxococcota bacterium]
MRPLLISVTLLAVLGLACDEPQPCHTCAPVDGTYTVEWDRGDGGVTDGGINEACPGPRVASWTFAQPSPSQVTTTLKDVTLAGTYLDSYDLLLSGVLVGERHRLKALVIPEASAFDGGGIRLVGSYTRQLLNDDAGCRSVETFTAQRTSR